MIEINIEENDCVLIKKNGGGSITVASAKGDISLPETHRAGLIIAVGNAKIDRMYHDGYDEDILYIPDEA